MNDSTKKPPKVRKVHDSIRKPDGTSNSTGVHNSISKAPGTSGVHDKNYYIQFATGAVIYFIIIIVVIPIFLYKNKFYTLLLAYIPNVDLIANVLTWWKGPGGIFKHLYLQIPASIPSLISQIFINYLALLGLTFIIINNAIKHKDFFIGWGMGAIMLLTTYLTPAKMVNYVMQKMESYINNKGIVAILGSLVTALIIFVEYTIIKNYKSSIAKLAKGFINMPDLLLIT